MVQRRNVCGLQCWPAAQNRSGSRSSSPSRRQGLPALQELALPGDFKDELGLANLLDMPRLVGLRDFIVDLGGEELTFLRYVRSYLSHAFDDAADPKASEKKLRAVELLAERMGTIEDEFTKTILQRARIIKCTDGVFRQPADVYFANQLNLAILGPRIHRAAWSTDSPLKDSVSRLYRWLGVFQWPHAHEDPCGLDQDPLAHQLPIHAKWSNW